MGIEKKLFLLIVVTLLAQAQLGHPDKECMSVTCPVNFRCEAGKCLQQERQAKKSLCWSPEIIDLKTIRAVKCTNRDYSCDKAKEISSCGLTFQGDKIDFSNDCDPCLDATVDYYYRLPCTKTPTTCNQNQECVNGKCLVLFDSPEDKNLKICNENSDCIPIIEICVANKCIKRQDLLKALSKNKPSST